MGTLVGLAYQSNVKVGENVIVPFGAILTSHDAGKCIDAAMSEYFFEQKGKTMFTGKVVRISKRYLFGLLKRKHPLYTIQLDFVDVTVDTYTVMQ